ncbi:discoidin domain-containing protein [Carboxylicivirga sp. RSCT41]|uniref:discoidin domain-containing protein n=1 Tax=Carboxylicivirga agarovorans TaxID=3417570 RepID=UPI003D33FD71
MKKITFLLTLLLTFSFTFAQNVALNKTGTASTASQPANNAFDGDGTSRWESAFEDPQWIYVDLTGVYSITGVKLNWEGAFASAYTVDVSSDAVNWTTVFTESAGDGGVDDITFASVSARYVRMHGTTRGTGYGYSLWEFEVYGTLDETSVATLSDLQVDGSTVEGFQPGILDYNIALPDGTVTVPTVTATTTKAAAGAVVNAAGALPGTTTVVVTAEDGVTTVTYNVNFTIQAPAAPVPGHDAVDVLSVYSDSYTSIATNLNPWWNQSTVVTEVQLDGNNTLKYENLNYQGMDYTSSDVTAMEYLHINYYTTDATALVFSLIGGGQENAYNVATDGSGIVTGQWVSLDIPLTHYTSPDLSMVSQFKTEGNGTVYIDNLFFWREPQAAGTDASLSEITIDGEVIDGFNSLKTAYNVDLVYGTTTVPVVDATTSNAAATYDVTPASGIPGTTSIEVTAADGTTKQTYTISFEASIPGDAAPAPSLAEANVISVYSDAYATNIAIDLNPGWGQSTVYEEMQLDGNNTLKYGQLDYQGTVYANTDVSAMEYLHFDYWTSNATALELYLIAGGENSYNVDTELGITTGQWVSVDIPLSYYADAGRDLTAAHQFKVTGNGTVYFDNLYFWKSTATNIETKVDADFSVYPNPVVDIVNINSPKTIESVQVYNLSGNCVHSEILSTNNASIDISLLNKGVYIMKVMVDGTAGTTKLIKK